MKDNKYVKKECEKCEIEGGCGCIQETGDCRMTFNRIVIKKSQTADTRTCDFTKVSKETLLQSSEQHIGDVRKGMSYLARCLEINGSIHDHTKISHIDMFHRDFATGFKTQEWWDLHRREERHHLYEGFIKDDVNLLDIIEQIVDGVMAGMARSGSYRQEPINKELLEKAYNNTVKLLLSRVVVED